MRLLPLLCFVLCFVSCKNKATDQKENLESPNWALLPFTKADSNNPVLEPDSVTAFVCPIIGKVNWEAKDVFNPAAVVRHDTLFLLYRAEDKVGKYAGTSRIGLAWSTDGLHVRVEPMSIMRAKIAEHMVNSRRTA